MEPITTEATVSVVPSHANQFKSYPYKWVVSLVYFLVGFANAITWITYSPIANIAQEYYSVSSFSVDMFAMIYMITYVPLAFVGSWTLDRGGLVMGTMIGAAFTIIGVWIRLLGVFHYGWALLGQAVCSFAQPFLLSAAPKLAANWFGEEQRAVATTIASLANPVGVAVGFILPPAIATSSDLIPRMLLVQAIAVTILSYPTFWFIKERPPTPPSLSASKNKQENFFQSLRLIVVNPNMWILFFEFGFGLGAFNCLATVLNSILSPYNYSNDQISAIGAAVVVSGLVGSGIAGVILDKTKRYKIVLAGCLVLATLSMLTFAFTLKPDRLWPLMISAIFLGFSTTPIIPVTFETSAEMMFPLGEATPTSFLLCGGQLTGIVFVIWMGQLLKEGRVFDANLIVIVCLAASAIIVLILRVDMKRTTFDALQKIPDSLTIQQEETEESLLSERQSLLE